jgi:hypothetical protein
MNVTIRRVGVLSLAKVTAVVSGIIGLIFGLIVACIAVASTATLASMTEELGFGGEGLVFALVYAVCFPLVYAVFGFIGGLIYGLVYNAAAGLFGGLELQLDGLTGVPPAVAVKAPPDIPL